jgi:hypothetical protein
MKKTFKITESKLITLIKDIIREQEMEEVVITPEQYYDLMRKVFYKTEAIPSLPPFKNKTLVVSGDLELNDPRIKSLGKLKILGKLNISGSKISSLDDVEVTGYVSDWNTPLYNIKQQRILNAKISEQESLREDDEWNLNDTDEVGEMAHAAFEFANNRSDITALTNEELERVNEIRKTIQELEEEQENLDTELENWNELYDDITDRIGELEDELNELKDDKSDVYDFYPSGRHYDLHEYECLTEDMKFAVGTTEEADSSLRDYFEEWIDNPLEYLGPDRITHYVDADMVIEAFEDGEREYIEENPEDYGISRDLSYNQEQEVQDYEKQKLGLEVERFLIEKGGRTPLIEDKIDSAKYFKFKDYLDNIFVVEFSDEWELYQNGKKIEMITYSDEEFEEQETDNQTRLDEIESEISDIEYEIDEINENPDGDFNQDEINDRVETMLEDIRYDPYDWLKDRGFDNKTIVRFIDKDVMLDDLVRYADYGSLNGYDSEYDEVSINDTYYVVMRID